MNTKTTAGNGGPPSPARIAALEKCPAAAKRMGFGSVSNFYRIAKRDGLRIIKTGTRASAVVSADVDAWISARVAGAESVQPSAREMCHECEYKSFNDLDDDAYVNDRTIAGWCALSVSTIWRYTREGKLPQPVRISSRCTRWRVGDVRQALAAIAASQQGGQQ